MLDPKLVRQNPQEIAEKLLKKGYRLDVAQLNELEAQRKQIQVETEQLQSERNLRSKNIGKAKAAGEDITPLLAEVNQMGGQLEQAKTNLQEVQEKLEAILMDVPNLPDDSVPEGISDEDNLVERH